MMQIFDYGTAEAARAPPALHRLGFTSRARDVAGRGHGRSALEPPPAGAWFAYGSDGPSERLHVGAPDLSVNAFIARATTTAIARGAVARVSTAPSIFRQRRIS